jgi:sulfane dehydrogenase subunit SoxC
VIVAYGQNGEMVRPEQGYPLRLLVPGVQGVSSVKWLRRLKVGDVPWETREESLHYVDLLPGGIHRQYTWIQEAKSVITSPSGGQVILDRGQHEITGLAWSGRGRVRRVDVSTDGGRNWRTALEPVLRSVARFRLDWRWDGAAMLQSRDRRTGYVADLCSFAPWRNAIDYNAHPDWLSRRRRRSNVQPRPSFSTRG